MLRKPTRKRNILPNDDSALESLFLSIREAPKNWMEIHHWKPAWQGFQAMVGEERVPSAALRTTRTHDSFGRPPEDGGHGVRFLSTMHDASSKIPATLPTADSPGH